ncbi:MAG: sigma factor-like helix-turn-helix DNA-binding protein [Lachnospiraceae bacterium]|nr:sigma factor-like helix-turn-helix DNA-binding protein [Lachnospiraceae bacterium]MDD3617580.1 sigma factor-like helix-turn-helix DNA-binding protein [Lachnospiraceae bacterium]
MRDDGMIKVSRNLKEMSVRIYLVREVLENRLQREPNVEEIALEMGVEMEDVVLALDAGTEIESLQKVIYQGENNEITLMDKIPKALGEEELILDRLWLTQVLGLLKKEERALLYKRYFQNKTQSKIAQEMGISQVQVSRMEKKILIFLRGKL